ncbi:MAG TPA: DNA polymerase IV [Acidimicrobiales bacterium]|nr:DNA polymerase IV [Acidimicrobiales bacterium]
MAEAPPAPVPGGADPEEAERCTVLHVDMDAFFAAVEVLDDPTLAGRPVIVGGAGARGVVASCTYEARAYGIHSAMPSVEARRRCPDALFLPGRYARYAEMSERLHDVLHRFSPVVEGIGLDEAFVDVRGARRLLGPPPAVGALIREAVRRDLVMDCAVGVARTKLLAKLASRAAKPTPTPHGPRPGPGVVVVVPSEELAFLHPLPVRALWGVGPATARRLEGLGVHSVADLARVPTDTLCRVLGTAAGRLLAGLAAGEDPRRVEASREPKSVGHEETFATDLRDQAALHRHVVRMADAVATRLRAARLAGRTVTVKVRFGDRSTITRSHTVGAAVDSARAVAAVAGALVEAVDVSPGVRLLGVSLSGLGAAETTAMQLRFEDAGPGLEGPGGPPPPSGAAPAAEGPGTPALPGRAGAWAEVEAAVAAVRARYGNASVGPAALVGRRGGLDLKERGDTQWGPAVEGSPS